MRRFERPYLWFSLLALLLLAGGFVWQCIGPTPAINVSRETTYITTPLRADGMPDYERYVLDRQRDGVTPENNAAVLLWQAMGPVEQQVEDFDVVCREIGIGTLPPSEEFLREAHDDKWQWRLQQWLIDAESAVEPGPAEQVSDGSPGPGNAPADVARELTEQVHERPWTREQIPPLGEWLDQNSHALDRLVRGSRLPRFYSPSPELLNHSPESLISSLLPAIQSMRSAARSLAIRAMGHLGEERYGDAWEDSVAIYRWSFLVGDGSSLVGQLVSFAIEGIAHPVTLGLLDSDDLSEEMAATIHHDLRALPSRRATIAQTIDRSERLLGLSAVVDEFLPSKLANGPTSTFLSFDWNIPLRRLNRSYDAMLEAASVVDWQARAKALSQLDADIDSRFRWSGFQKFIAQLSRRQRSELMASTMMSLLLPALSAALTAEDRTNTQRELVRLAAALAVYRTERGAYPDTLEALVPDVREKLPVDLYRGQPFVYRRTQNGYVLYSRGPNGKDDGGSNKQLEVFRGYSASLTPASMVRQLLGSDMPAQADREDSFAAEDVGLVTTESLLCGRIPADADDISIRLPRPKLVLPAP